MTRDARVPVLTPPVGPTLRESEDLVVPRAGGHKGRLRTELGHDHKRVELVSVLDEATVADAEVSDDSTVARSVR